ncbi:MAG TPA: 4-amino-4-deoxy-L-arabinose transferase [Microcoleaceae bacterium UBA10368]|jgi:4-amino-4-deoxy-L-arabinose transferase and related glycosyltransferases of PMT family|nr:4-amino-4-deoxy-L-arabinose transferase [Microcoleaceae cyanobacterium UBA10368]HCV29820.1 4-amino-4-deoxy-L-arabinose transferase [Microcoleaceae cyanobacterium UBA9251]
MIADIFGLIPLVSLGLLFLIFKQIDKCWRTAILSAAVVWGSVVALSTEILSLFELLTFEWVLGLWLVADILWLIIYLKLNSVKPDIRSNDDSQLSSFLLWLLAGISLIFAAVGLIAVVSPPNNWDSMTYHMSRVVHWMQNRSVEHYPTSYVPQLYHPPGAEFAIMHFQIISGGDRFANLIQWLSMVGSAIAVSLIAKQLGANLRGQVFAAVFAATLPMGILQGSSTQNDYAVCFWVVCFVSCGLAGMSAGITLSNTLKIGASLGLALLTKTTAYIFSIPFILWFIIVGIKRFHQKMLPPILMIAAVTLILNIGHFWRNYDLFGYLIGAPQDFTKEYKIEIFTLPTFLSNIIRNLAMHTGTSISKINGLIVAVVKLLHKILGILPNDPRITWPPGQVYALSTPSFNENNATNPIHFGLIFATIMLISNNPKLRQIKIVIVYLTATITTFLLLCLLLKFQPWQSRHHLTIFVLFAPLFGLTISQLSNYKIANYIVLIMIFMSLPWIFNNKFRPLLGESNIFNSRNELYFTSRPNIELAYYQAVDFVKSQNCTNIGLSFWTKNSWEYPLWVLFQQPGKPTPRIEHISTIDPVVEKKLNSEPYKSFIPCAIVYQSTKDDKQGKEIVVKNQTYVQKFTLEPLSVFLKK